MEGRKTFDLDQTLDQDFDPNMFGMTIDDGQSDSSDSDDESHYEKEASHEESQGPYGFLGADVMAVMAAPQSIKITPPDELEDDSHYEKEFTGEEQETGAYGGLGAEVQAILAAGPKRLASPSEGLSPSDSLSLSSSLIGEVIEDLSESGTEQLMGAKIFGEDFEKARLAKEKSGAGSNGDVFEAELFYNEGTETNFPKKCAIKKAKEKSSTSANNLRKFFRTLKKLEEDKTQKEKLHHLMVPYGSFYGKPSQKVYLCMPLADFDGDILIELMHHLSPEEKLILIRYITFSLVKAFADMDALNIRHLDVKPSNIMFTALADYYINDFDTSYVFDENGKYKHKAENPNIDRRFQPQDQLGKEDTSAILNQKFKLLDAYRLGLTLFLMCIAKPELVDTKLNEMKDRGYPSINDLLEGVLDSAEKIDAMLIENNIPEDIRQVITGLLAFFPEDRLTIQNALELVKSYESSFQKDQIVSIFTQIDMIRREMKAKTSVGEKEDSKEKEAETSVDTDLIVDTDNLHKIFAIVSENQVEIEGEDMNEILEILSHDSRTVDAELSSLLEKYQGAGKSTGNLVEASTHKLAETSGIQQVAAQNFTHRLFGKAKEAVARARSMALVEEEEATTRHDNPLAQSSFNFAPRKPGKSSDN